MKKLNLSALSASELQQLKSDIEKELNERSSKLQAIDEVRKLAAAKGLRMEDLFAELGVIKPRGKRELGPAPVRYRHPENASLTWSGRGKRPNWMKEAMANGLQEDSMRV